MINAIAIRQPYLIIKPLNLRWIFNLRIFIILLSGLIFFLLFFYIFQVNKLTSDNYLISSQEKTLADISKENKALEIDSNQVNSLANIDNLAKNFGFEKVNKITYVKVLEGSMAAK